MSLTWPNQQQAKEFRLHIGVSGMCVYMCTHERIYWTVTQRCCKATNGKQNAEHGQIEDARTLEKHPTHTHTPSLKKQKTETTKEMRDTADTFWKSINKIRLSFTWNISGTLCLLKIQLRWIAEMLHLAAGKMLITKSVIRKLIS